MSTLKIGKYLLIPFAIFISAIPVIDPFNVFTSLRNSAFDTFQIISPRQSQTKDNILILDIDEKSLSEIGQWPWSRSVLSELVDQTNLSAALAFDIVFAEADRTGSKELMNLYKKNNDFVKSLKGLPDNDDLFANSIKDHGTVVLGAIPSNSLKNNFQMRFGLIQQGDDPKKFLREYKGIQTNLKILNSSSAGIGSMSIGNNDSIIRKLPLFENINGSLVPSLSLELLRVAIGASTYQIKSSNASGETAFGEETGINHVKLGNLIIPTNPDGSVWIHYPEVSVDSISVSDIIKQKYPKDFFKDKILIVGTSAPGLFDLRSTPLKNNVPGVKIIADLTDQILSGSFLQRPDWIFGLELFTGFALAILITIFIQFLGPIGGLSVFLIGNGISIFGSFYIFENYLFLIDPISPLIICLISYLVITFFNFLFTELERRKVRNAFSQYMSPVMVEKLAQSNKSLKLGGERREMTFLFSDIRGFTAISEKYKDDPESLTVLINSILTVLSDEVLDQDGTIDKYMGDCIMAFWNAPSEDPFHREKSIEAAFKMSEALNKLNESLDRKGENKLSIGIGINSGECIVGNMGSEKRFDYTVLGDPVNLASRLEGQSGAYGFQRILGQETVNALKSESTLFELDLIQVKGKTEPVKIFTSFNNFSLKDEKLAEFQKDHKEFLENYRNQQWDIALNFVKKWEERVVEFDLYYAIFEERIKDMKLNLTDPNWNGAYVATSK